MKSIKTCLLTVAALLGSISAYAHDFEMDGIYYNITSDATVEVTFRGSAYDIYDNEYSGDIIIPSTVTYSRKEYSVTSIGERAFASCTGLTSVTIPNSVTSIGSGAFWICPGLTSVTIPNSVTSIGYEAFRHCSGLTSVTIGNSVTSIGSSAFYGCSGLTSVTIPNSVTSIGDYAFAGCSGLTSVTIPNSVTSIGKSAFADCAEQLDVYCYAEKVPSTESNAFDGSDIEYATLHVPAASIESYKATEPWSKFGKIVALTDDETAISEVQHETVGQKTTYFDLSGRRINNAQNGIYIQNGEKVLVK